MFFLVPFGGVKSLQGASLTDLVQSMCVGGAATSQHFATKTMVTKLNLASGGIPSQDRIASHPQSSKRCATPGREGGANCQTNARWSNPAVEGLGDFHWKDYFRRVCLCALARSQTPWRSTCIT